MDGTREDFIRNSPLNTMRLWIKVKVCVKYRWQLCAYASEEMLTVVKRRGRGLRD
jgi:hypothetical protein